MKLFTPAPTVLVESAWESAYIRYMGGKLLEVRATIPAGHQASYLWEDSKGLATAAAEDWRTGRAQYVPDKFTAKVREMHELAEKAWTTPDAPLKLA